ncbi:hypothetical protein MtrunA17_Chr7g0273981 [Medicago truncatula]|uniref:MtN26 n=1 Tax=Medicago truncatula TaxID=3880 RepID=G7L1U2_MEDTR|nr:uncharacterized protein LOC11432827 [Medicago truncatula]AES82640.1 hypothetical protein MTR_7g114890 [Medicago truncatula]RHN49389.1 hypothetical protein MtrunA17_Chr7g0273981 [Medicago truncatula]
MGSCKFLILLAVVYILLLRMTVNAKGSFFHRYRDKICREVECGKGKCGATSTHKNPFSVFCECEPGWQQIKVDPDYSNKFPPLPCVIPECTINDDCKQALPLVPEKDFQIPHNMSHSDPCYLAFCGEGTCIKNSKKQKHNYKYRCECKPNYFNLLNMSGLPCYNKCSLGSDCSKLGIKIVNSIADNSVLSIASSTRAKKVPLDI